MFLESMKYSHTFQWESVDGLLLQTIECGISRLFFKDLSSTLPNDTKNLQENDQLRGYKVLLLQTARCLPVECRVLLS